MLRLARVVKPTPVRTLLLASALLLPLGAKAADARSPADTVAEIRRLLTDLPGKRTVCSAKIVDLTAGTVVLELDADRSLVPASNQKLWVLAAAASDLGESFAFRTVLALAGNDVCVIGGGDPGFGDQRLVEARGGSITGELDRWAEVLASRGITSLVGRLVYDDALFDEQWTHPSWEPGDLVKWYAAPVSALAINDNCVKVILDPAEIAGSPVTWSMIPPNDAVEVVNRCVSGGKGPAVINRPGREMRVVVSGSCPKRWEFPEVAVSDPVVFFAGTFQRRLAERGIATDGKVRARRVRLPNGDLPPGLVVLAEHRTPLADLLGRIGKDSQNLFAESVLKRLGYERERRIGISNPVGSWDSGRAAVRDFAGRAGLTLTPDDFHDSSGLSRDNRMSAAQAVGLLSYMYHHRARELFVASLSVAGRDGSLRRRMSDLGGFVYAKTGYVRGVRTLSGYVVTPTGRWFAFSILFNRIKGPTKPYNQIHDRVCGLLADWPEGWHTP